jgi:hypothetical protein
MLDAVLALPIELIKSISVSIGERLAATFGWDSAIAARQRLAIADSIEMLALRNNDLFANFAQPDLELLFRSLDSESQQL